VVGTPAGRDAAAQFLAQFRSQRFAAITVDSAQHKSPMDDLQNYGTLVNTMVQSNPTEVPSTEALATRTGLPLKLPQASTLPAGFGATRRYYVTPEAEVRFTLDKAKTAAYLQSIGKGGFTFPDKFNGATLIVSVPKTALISYGDSLGIREGGATAK